MINEVYGKNGVILILLRRTDGFSNAFTDSDSSQDSKLSIQ